MDMKDLKEASQQRFIIEGYLNQCTYYLTQKMSIENIYKQAKMLPPYGAFFNHSLERIQNNIGAFKDKIIELCDSDKKSTRIGLKEDLIN